MIAAKTSFNGSMFAVFYRYVEQSGLAGPPVTSEIIEQFHFDLPVEIREVSLKSARGAVWRLEDAYILHVNIDDPPGKIRATALHGMFQIIAHRGSNLYPRIMQLGAGFFNELLADYFAAAMLVPDKWLEEYWLRVSDLNRMAEIFQVSEIVIWIRLAAWGESALFQEE